MTLNIDRKNVSCEVDSNMEEKYITYEGLGQSKCLLFPNQSSPNHVYMIYLLSVICNTLQYILFYAFH